ncbi:beta subunit of N-acylethanolamine-hydrolyzing acid amidase-domain-containing protein [Xylaria sp. FL1777]|nr:beta subunit of N-acylethanolamine-hydrolyzing acid amidase-domain-containing protein [Xylaria sp. FL1777]
MSTPAACEEPIPRFTIDLAKAPRERYHEVVHEFGPRMRSLTGLFDGLLSIFIASTWLRSIIIGLSKVCLRRVHDEEENEEIKGIASASGVPLYLLVALNNLLDCLLGCTSGAVPISPGKASRRTGDETRLLHFRALDWGMDELRDLLVVLEFVDSASDNPSRVVARSITYAGFVGSLTAVRPGLSISLNQRVCHDCPSRQLRWHQLMVLLGKRKSIGSIVRSFMLRHSQTIDEAEDGAGDRNLISPFVKQARALAVIPSAPCYLILCDGREAAVIIKDRITGTVRSTTDFIAQTNHDPEYDEAGTARKHETTRQDRRQVITSSFGIEGWEEESVDRLECLQKKWDRLEHKFRAKSSFPQATPNITETTLRKWISDYPTLNECTHFTSILDPVTGKIRWLIRGPLEDSE